MTDVIKLKDFIDAAGGDGWRVTSEGACAFYRTASLADAARFVARLSDVPGLAAQSYGIDVRRDGVTVRTITVRDDHFGLTQADLDVALRISAVARKMGVESDPSQIQSLLIVPGALDVKAVMPFWRAALAYEPRPDSPEEDLIDPRDRNAPFWFEGMEQPRADGLGAIHIAVWLPTEQAEARVEAALAAGGRLVRDDFAPAWWTLADAAGNEVDIATIEHRD